MVFLSYRVCSGQMPGDQEKNTREMRKFRSCALSVRIYLGGSAGNSALTLRTRSATFWAPMRSITQAR